MIRIITIANTQTANRDIKDKKKQVTYRHLFLILTLDFGELKPFLEDRFALAVTNVRFHLSLMLLLLHFPV